MTMEYYDMIFKRKSFHVYKNTEKLTDGEIDEINAFLKSAKPLYPEIAVDYEIVPTSAIPYKKDAEYCILFYSEAKDGYLRNIGYIGQQLDLYCASKNIGALWYGLGKPQSREKNGLQFVIMMAFSKMPADKFRKDVTKAKRKPVKEIWQGDTLGIAEVTGYAPSACNSQPWLVENDGNILSVYRYKKQGRIGIMPPKAALYFNRIDMGIYLFILEVCLRHAGIDFSSEQFTDTADETAEKTLIAKYKIG